MFTITKTFKFEAAHRLLGHQGKCRFLHGHSYRAEVTVLDKKSDGSNLDSLGMVVDFKVLKDTVGKWIDDNFDHNIILHEDDPLLYAAKDHLLIFDGKAPYIMGRINPTAENMSSALYYRVSSLLRAKGIEVVSVKVFETESCCAEYKEQP